MAGVTHVQAVKKTGSAEASSRAAAFLDQRPVALAQRHRAELAAQSPGAHALQRQQKLASASASVQRKLTVAANVAKHAQKINIPDYDSAVQQKDQAFIREFNHYHLLQVADNIPFLKEYIEHDLIKVSIAQGIHVNTSKDRSYTPELRPHQTLKVDGHPQSKLSKDGPSWHVIWRVENGKLAYVEYTQENDVDAEAFLKANEDLYMLDLSTPMEYDKEKYAGYMEVGPTGTGMDQNAPEQSVEGGNQDQQPTMRDIALHALQNSPEGTEGWHTINDGQALNSEHAIHQFVLANLDNPDSLCKLSVGMMNGMTAKGVKRRMRSIYLKYLGINAALMLMHDQYRQRGHIIINYLRSRTEK
jgi:hypothetical protein